MARTLSTLSVSLLNFIQKNSGATFHEINSAHSSAKTQKSVYDTLFRLTTAGLLKVSRKRYTITEEGREVIHTKKQVKDGIWKIVIFDIAESDRYVRNFLRQRLKLLGFQKWQNSIWVSPYALDESIEKEFADLAKRYFIRLIKTKDINFTSDLLKLFPESDTKN